MNSNKDILTKKCILKFMWETVDLIDSEEIVELLCENREARRGVFEEIYKYNQEIV